jgi:predicted RNase H-like HicB family nuclease
MSAANPASDRIRYQRVVMRQVDDEGNLFYVAVHPELKGCTAQGETAEEAIKALNEARALYLEALQRAGIAPPAPGMIHFVGNGPERGATPVEPFGELSRAA